MLKIAICDDEKIFRNNITDILQGYIKDRGIVCEIETYSSGKEFVDLGIEMLKYDVVFLDVHMNELDGLMTARRIRENSKDIFIVFITAFINYTLEGYKVDAIRYILKDNDNMASCIYECMDAIYEKLDYKVTWKKFLFKEGAKKVSLERIPSVYKGTYGRKRTNFCPCCVAFIPHTSSMRQSSALHEQKLISFRLFDPDYRYLSGFQGRRLKRTGRTLIEDNAENRLNIIVLGVCPLLH